MFTQVKLSVRQATEEDRNEIYSMLQLEPYVHRHLDWRPPIDWLGHQPYLVAERNGNLIATLACPPDPPKVAWIRTFATVGYASTIRTWKSLWGAAQAQLSHPPGICVAAIPLYKWFKKILAESGFRHTHNVVLLAWEGTEPPAPESDHIHFIRPMGAADLPTVTDVDNAAFSTLWQNSQDSLTLAHRQSVHATVAEENDAVVGYQISTASPHGWHLARLAVDPQAQQRGIAYALVRDMLIAGLNQGATHISVNTQHDNLASLYLYAKAGFFPTGEEYPVYQYDINT